MKNKYLMFVFMFIGGYTFAGQNVKPKVAVVIDDFGITYKSNPPDNVWMELPSTMTFAVMPASPLTKKCTESTKNAGKELIIHFPFDPYLKLELYKDTATVSDIEKVSHLLDQSIGQITGAVGLNNHRSLKATQNRPLMHEFMRLLKEKNIYFLDSFVSSSTVAGQEAKLAGIATATNYMFLDTATIHTQKFCQKVLAEAVAHAKHRGHVIVIGHHYYYGTYDCLKQEMPKYVEEGIEFVRASALVKKS